MNQNLIKSKALEFLRWTEKWTHTNMVYFSKGGFWLGINQIVTMGSAFLLSLAFANLLPTDVYGNYKYVLSIVSLISIPTLAGMSTSLTQAVARGFEGTLIPATKERMRWGLLAGLFSLFAAGYYYFGGNLNLTLTFLITAVFLPLMDPLGSYVYYLSGKKYFRQSARYNTANQLLILIATITTLVLTKNLLIIIAVYFISRTTINAAFTKLVIMLDKPNDKIDRESISYGKHLTAMNIIGWIAAQLDKILIFHYLGAVELAVYSFAMAPIDQLNSGIYNNIRILAFPKFAESDPKILKQTLPSKILKFTLLTVCAAIAFAAFAPYVYGFIFPKYLASVAYAQYYAITLAILPLSLFNTAITAKAQKKKLYFLSVTISAVRIGLLLALLPIYGIAGAIAAIIGSTVYSNIATFYLFKKI